MSGTDGEIVPRHPFFRAMVTMGGAITLGCGGVTNTGASKQREPGGDGGAGGSLFVGAGGQVVIASGGSAGQQEPVPIPCAPAQWRCGADNGTCTGSIGYREPGPCRCDPDAPLSPGDCGTGSVRICRQLAVSPGAPVDAGLSDRFDCWCVDSPPKDADCNVACQASYPDVLDHSPAYCRDDTQAGGRDILCGCAVIFLK